MALNELADLASVINLVQGGKTRVTEQTQLSEEAVQELARSLLSGESGLANIGSATRKSGLYNSSTQERLMNDLIARVSAQTAVAGAPKTTVTQAPSTGIVPLVATLAGASLLNSAIKKGGKLLSGAGAASAKTAAPIVEATPMGVNAATKVATGVAGKAAENAIDTLGLVPGEGVTTAATTSGLSSALRANAIPGLGGLVSGILQGEDALDPENLLLTGGVPLLLGAGLPGALAALGGTAIGSFGGDIFEGIGDIGKNIVESVGDFFGGLF